MVASGLNYVKISIRDQIIQKNFYKKKTQSFTTFRILFSNSHEKRELWLGYYTIAAAVILLQRILSYSVMI